MGEAEVMRNPNTSERLRGIGNWFDELIYFRQPDLFDISKATDIHGTKFDNPANPVAVNGALDSSITPATYVPFVNYIDETQLARFGLHNGEDLISAFIQYLTQTWQANLMTKPLFVPNGSHSHLLHVTTPNFPTISSYSQL